MKLATSKGIEYEVMWAGLRLTHSREMIVQMEEKRPLVDLITEMDGIDWAKTSGPAGQPDREYQGPMRLMSAARLEDGNVLITLEMEGAA